MTKKQFILWATSHGFTRGSYGNMIRHTRNHYQKVVRTERFRLCKFSVAYEVLEMHKTIKKRTKAITWEWKHVQRIPYKRMHIDENNNSYALDLTLPPKGTQLDHFPV